MKKEKSESFICHYNMQHPVYILCFLRLFHPRYISRVSCAGRSGSMEVRVEDVTTSSTTSSSSSPSINDSALTVVYHEENDRDLVNNNQDEQQLENLPPGSQEYIVVTLDDDQSIDSVLSNLSEHYQLNSNLQRELVVVNVDDGYSQEALLKAEPQAEVEEEELVAIDRKLPPEVIWAGGGDGSMRVLTDCDGDENSLSASQVIYVNSDDVVSTEPTDQFIVLDPR